MVSALTGNADRDPSLLLLDYEMLRDDDRSLIGTQVQSFSIGIATLGLLGALVVRALDETKEHLPDFALVGAPLIPLSLFVYMVTMAPPSIIRSFYGRLLERQLHKHFAERKQADGASRYDSRLQFPSYFELSVGVQRLSRGSTTVRVFVALLALLVTLIFCGITAVLILKTDSLAIKLAAIPFYSVTVSAMVWHAIRLNIRGREYFYRQVQAFEEARRDRLLPVVKNVRERSLLSYLVFPRPADLAKWLFFPIGAMIAFFGSDAAFEPIRFVTMLLALEYLVYSARYQINDIRGISEDLRSPQSRGRGRLPVRAGMPTSIIASLLVVAVRVYAALVIAFAPSLHLAWNIIAALVLVMVSAVMYEWLRGVERRNYRDHPTELPDRKVMASASALTLFVGIGYVIRTVLGLTFYPSRWPFVDVLLPISVFAFGLGIVFVSMTWALEGIAYLTHRPHGTRPLRFSTSILEKPHLLQLAFQLPWRGGRRTSAEFTSDAAAPGASSIRAFIDPFGGASHIPWPRFGLSSRWGQAISLCGLALGYLTFGAIAGPWYIHALGALGGGFLALAAAPTGLLPRLSNIALRIVAAVLILAAAVGTALAVRGTGDITLLVVSAVGWVSLFSVMAMFVGATHAQLVHFVAGVKAALAGSLRAVLGAVVGREALRVMGFDAGPPVPDGEAGRWPNDSTVDKLRTP